MTVTSPAAARVLSRPARMLISLIEIYRHMISPLRLPCCRFMPTCSQYAVEAITEFGLLRGGWLALRRLGKCGPWHTGGWDPVPDQCANSGEGAEPQLRSANV
ncbi:membrane protein insertion efficiency factor YidD [Mycolicibacterium sp.]|uniref:membrane protein insertion efficiency factor YidD n=1 Tax=Mycolicibacterium sp. TaxID=2320850 RepID=UPI001A21FB38|nr:membrane protein insertion efficiency factor YidD [Mycolicibacterium sp.]MBJ7401492.1 membrane protein insertion efficiency factor YidD [Mycolicibacterium sp.]